MDEEEVMGMSLLVGARLHRAAFEESRRGFTEQLKKLRVWVQKRVLLTTRDEGLKKLIFAEYEVIADQEGERVPTETSPWAALDRTLSCVVKRAGISKGMSYLVVFVMDTTLVSDSASFNKMRPGYEYKIWLEDLKAIKLA